MEDKLKQGVDKDWEYTHIVWRRPEPKDKRDWSAMLLDPGTAKIMGYMGVRPDHKDMLVEFNEETGQGRAQMKVQLVTILPILYLNIKTGEPVPYHPAIAEGVGSCTTREKRFRVRWENYTGRALVADAGYTVHDLEDLKRLNPERLIRDNKDIMKCIFFMPDPAAAGADNSLLKICAKRAEMDAVFQVPGVAQRFSQELDLMSAEERERLGKETKDGVSEEEPQEEDWSDELEEKIKAMDKAPKWIRSQVDDIIAKSDGFVTTKKAALSVILKRLKKEKKKPKQEKKKPEPEEVSTETPEEVAPEPSVETPQADPDEERVKNALEVNNLDISLLSIYKYENRVLVKPKPDFPNDQLEAYDKVISRFLHAEWLQDSQRWEIPI